jgi:hypothetical protein
VAAAACSVRKGVNSPARETHLVTPPPSWTDLLASLQSSAFRDVAGTRFSAHVPVSRPLLNRLVNAALADASPHLRSVDIRPHAGDAFDVLVTVSLPFVPPINVAFNVERQPQFPASPELVLRWSFLGVAGVIASRVIASLDRLPPGVRLDGDRLVVDIPRLAQGTPAAPVLQYIKSLALHTAEDRFLIDVAMEIGS